MRIEDIEKLRAFALLMVLFGHMPVAVPPILMHGYTGVVLFFIISGYVCCLSFENAMGKYTTHSKLYGTLEFYISRFFRVVPLITIWLLIYFFLGQLVNSLGGSYGDAARFFKEFRWWSSGLYNYYFAYSRMAGLFGHLWSMAIEIQFYLILPLFFFLCTTPRKRNIGSIVIIIFSLISLAVTPEDVAGKLTHTQIGCIFVGVMIYENRGLINFKDKTQFISPTIKKSITGILIIFLFIIPYWLDGVVSPFVKYSIYMFVGGILVFVAQMDAGWYIGGKRITSVLKKIASLSFSTYVSHVLMYSCVYYNLYVFILKKRFPWLETQFGVGIQIIVLLLLALLTGELSSALIEKPYAIYSKKCIEKLREKYNNFYTNGMQ